MPTPVITGATLTAANQARVVRLSESATNWQHQLIVTGSGAVSASVTVFGTTDTTGLTGRREIATLTASGTTSASDNTAVVLHAWACLVYVCNSISGAGAVAQVGSNGAP